MNIKKKPLRRPKLEIDNSNLFSIESMDEFKEPDTWTIITALDRVLDMERSSQLSDDFWESVKNPLAFLRQELGLTNIQLVVIAIMIEAGEAVTWKRLGNFLGCSRLSMMVYS